MPNQDNRRGGVSQRARNAKAKSKLFVAPGTTRDGKPKVGRLGPWAALASLKRRWANGGTRVANHRPGTDEVL